MASPFALIYHYTDDTAGRDQHRPAHREYLSTLIEEGSLRVCGPWDDDAEPGALMIYVAETAEQVSAMAAADPFVREGLVAEYEVRSWNAVLGPLVETLRS